jgi:RNA polymerase sigma factor (sigma-70 family)
MKQTDINILFLEAQTGDKLSEHHLFSILRERFLYLTRLRVWDPVQAEEIVQGAMLIIAREYRELVITSSFVAWSHKVLDNKIKDYIRSYKRERRWTEPESPPVENIASSKENSELIFRLMDCLRKMSLRNRRYARIINLHNIGFDADEICERLKMNEGSMYTLLHRSRAMLKKCLNTGEI